MILQIRTLRLREVTRLVSGGAGTPVSALVAPEGWCADAGGPAAERTDEPAHGPGGPWRGEDPGRHLE